MRALLSIVFASCGIVVAAAQSASAPQVPRSGLRILVIEGEGAVNIVQQKTAVAPVIEVRDRNDQPVAGAVVRFAIRSGKASFGGPKTLVLTTNASGRAAVTTLTPTGSGALQITAAASYQGQTAAISIAQTNVISAAASSAAGGAGAAGSAGGAAGGSGGLSATAIGVVAGAGVGGTLVAREVVQEDAPTIYSGTIAGDMTLLLAAIQGAAG